MADWCRVIYRTGEAVTHSTTQARSSAPEAVDGIPPANDGGIPFFKVDGAGNDFFLIDARDGNSCLAEQPWSLIAPRVCNRQSGIRVNGIIGADGVILVTDSLRGAVACSSIINADGSDGGFCGNGFRCVARYLAQVAGIEPNRDGHLQIETNDEILRAQFVGAPDYHERVRVRLGAPRLAPHQIPVLGPLGGPVLHKALTLGGRTFDLVCVSMGNPHAVLLTPEDVRSFQLSEIGPQVEHHPDFPDRTNFEVVNIANDGRLNVRVWERGVGETKACGSGACAVLVAAQLRGCAGPKATVSMPGGDLEIEWDGSHSHSAPVFMTGPAAINGEGAIPSEWIPNGHA